MRTLRSESGQTVSEYSILLALLVVATVLLVSGLSGALISLFQNVIDGLP